MRIISGLYKGRKLTPPEDNTVRPTSARMREAIFNILMHGEFGGEHIIGKRVADICCGTGALGLEALSRGAAHATFVDMSKHALKLAEKNAQHVGASSQCQFMHADATKLLKANAPYDVIFTDPPYDTPLLSRIVTDLIEKSWVTAGTLIVCELPAFGVSPPIFEGAEPLTERRYGKAALHIWKIS